MRRYKSNTCQNKTEISTELKKTAIKVRFNPYKVISNAPILPANKRAKRPKKGENKTGSKTGLLTTSLTDLKG
jgi:hypothetical protein